MKRLFLFFLIPCGVFGQALNNINYQYQYVQEYGFDLVIRKQNLSSDSIQIFFNVEFESPRSASDYQLNFFQYEGLSDKEGKEIKPAITYFHQTEKFLSGRFTLAESNTYLVARILHLQKKQAWLYFTDCKKELINRLIPLVNDSVSLQKHASIGSKISIYQHHSSFLVNYYKENFPAASPPYAEAQSMVSQTLNADSIFTVSSSFIANKIGLYVIQKNSSSKEFAAIRVEDDYPKFRKLTSLTAPFTYVTTKAEFNKIVLANGDKRSFDRSILTLTGDAERAKLFMRNYFKRVELANAFFSSYKEGWKTDRGMIFTIFGLPDAVYRTQTSEIWEYRTQGDKVSFTFVQTPTLFDPDNFVLIRKKKLESIWLEAVDLNRNARF